MTTGSFRLVEQTGPNPGAIHDLSKEISVIGRDVANDIVLNDAEVSRQHARLTQTPGGYVLEDLGSTNGTFVNGERLVAPRVLSAGDLVGLSEKVSLIFDAVTPETAATVVTPSAGQVAPQPPPLEVAPPAAAPPPADFAVPGDRTDLRRWSWAGCGCLVLLFACGGIFAFMDLYYPETLYAPIMPILRILGLIS